LALIPHPVKEFVPLKDVESVLPILSKIAIWGGVSDQQQKEIFRRLETGTFKKGEYVFRKGDEPTHIYIVKSGKIDLFISDQRVMIKKETLQVGGCFGVASLMAMQRHTATAMAIEESEVMVLSRKALLEFQDEDIRLFALLMMNTAREVARRLKLTDDILLRYVQKMRGDG
jgi:CRP/FNR family transcriptional regulator, cyclic AMP receptor protein